MSPEAGVPLEELEFRYVASSGPGGQHANKAATKVELRWPVTISEGLPADVRERFVARYAARISSEGVLVLRCQWHRSRSDNQRACVANLERMLAAVWHPPRPRTPTAPSRSSVEKRLEAKRRRSERKRARRESF
jgi:ribosome-associated protein